MEDNTKKSAESRRRLSALFFVLSYLYRLRPQFLQVGQALFRDGALWINLGEVFVDAVGLLVLADGLVDLSEHVVGLDVGAVERDELLEGGHGLFDLVGLKVVAGDDLLVMHGL